MQPEDFYKYVYNFGFGDKTGIQLMGTGESCLKNDGNIVNYATKSFGQGILVTPIQLISALSAIVNDGKYMRTNYWKVPIVQ